ncbi:hypothetical protein [Pyrobaculum ferrireducens]|uniref:hypothetical protein n=1 Tax=Pyrobaculum ferrireducens TaxID=1104324 RepID=UPI0011E551FF|nr:hypothetical protein [Pyrobaculum ferrireducens]
MLTIVPTTTLPRCLQRRGAADALPTVRQADAVETLRKQDPKDQPPGFQAQTPHSYVAGRGAEGWLACWFKYVAPLSRNATFLDIL